MLLMISGFFEPLVVFVGLKKKKIFVKVFESLSIMDQFISKDENKTYENQMPKQ